MKVMSCDAYLNLVEKPSVCTGVMVISSGTHGVEGSSSLMVWDQGASVLKPHQNPTIFVGNLYILYRITESEPAARALVG